MIYVLSKTKKNSKNFLLKIFIFYNFKNLCILHGHVFMCIVEVEMRGRPYPPGLNCRTNTKTFLEVLKIRIHTLQCKNNIASKISSFLTHLAYIANGKKRVILCNNFTGRISVTLLCGICDVSYPTKQR